MDRRGTRGEDEARVVQHRPGRDAPDRAPHDRVEVADAQAGHPPSRRRPGFRAAAARRPTSRSAASGSAAGRREPRARARADRAPGRPSTWSACRWVSDDRVEGGDAEPVEAAVDERAGRARRRRGRLTPDRCARRSRRPGRRRRRRPSSRREARSTMPVGRQRRGHEHRRPDRERRVRRDPADQRPAGEPAEERWAGPGRANPASPSGQGIVPPGTAANRRATCAMPVVGTDPDPRHQRGAAGHTTETSAAVTPATVTTSTSTARPRTPDDAHRPWRKDDDSTRRRLARRGIGRAAGQEHDRSGSSSHDRLAHGGVNSRHARGWPRRQGRSRSDQAQPRVRGAGRRRLASPSTAEPAQQRDELSPDEAEIAPIAAAGTATLGSDGHKDDETPPGRRGQDHSQRRGANDDAADDKPHDDGDSCRRWKRSGIHSPSRASLRCAGQAGASGSCHSGGAENMPRASAEHHRAASHSPDQGPARHSSPASQLMTGVQITVTASVATHRSAARCRYEASGNKTSRATADNKHFCRRSRRTAPPPLAGCPGRRRRCKVASRRTRARSPVPASTMASPVTTAWAVTTARSSASSTMPPRARRTE